MSNSSEVASFYKGVIDEVIRNVRTEFVNMGVDEQVLVDLQATWEQKLIDQKVFQASDYPLSNARDFLTSVPFFYSSVAAFPTTSIDMMPGNAAYIRRPNGVPQDLANFSNAGYNSLYASAESNEHPKNQYTTNPNSIGSIIDRGQSPGGGHSNKSFPPQFDGVDHESGEDESVEKKIAGCQEVIFDLFSNRPPKEEKSARENSSVVDQYDELFGCGPEDPAPDAKRIRPSEDLKNLDSKFPLNPVVISNKENSGDFKNKTLNGKGSELADELNSDLDDEEADAEEVDDEVVGDLVLCQYEKIHRVRSRWRGVLRSGIIHVADSDLCFNRSTIDLEW